MRQQRHQPLKTLRVGMKLRVPERNVTLYVCTLSGLQMAIHKLVSVPVWKVVNLQAFSSTMSYSKQCAPCALSARIRPVCCSMLPLLDLLLFLGLGCLLGPFEGGGGRYSGLEPFCRPAHHVNSVRQHHQQGGGGYFHSRAPDAFHAWCSAYWAAVQR